VAGANAQISTGTLGQDILRPSSASYYFIAKPSELSMQVNIWGFVRNPGRYEVPTSTDLIRLLSYAGGPSQDATLDNVRVTRGAYQPGGGRREFELDLQKLAEIDPADLVLYPDDTIYVDYSSWTNVRDIFAVVTVLAIVTSAVAQVIIATSR
jgi:protein involved in polysaccharide export with SLBB domain